MTIEDTGSEPINRCQLFATKTIFNGVICIDLSSLDERKLSFFREAEEIIEAKDRRDPYDLCNTLKPEHSYLNIIILIREKSRDKAIKISKESSFDEL